MKLCPAFTGIAAWVVFSSPAYTAALPFPQQPLLPNQQHRPAGVAVAGNNAGIITPGGIPKMFHKSAGGTWIESVELPAGALSISMHEGVSSIAAVGYSGRIELRAYNEGDDSWPLLETVVMDPGDRPGRLVLQEGTLAAIVDGADISEGTTARIIRDNAADWEEVRSISMPPASGGLEVEGSHVASLDLSGSRLAIGSLSRGEVWIHEMDQGGPGNWGQVKVITTPAGHASFGVSLALEGDRLAVCSLETASGKAEVTAYERNTGGADFWGNAGTIIDGSAPFGADLYLLDMSGIFLTALGIHGAPAISTAPAGGQARFFATGAGPGGWVLEAQRDLGLIYTPPSAQPLSLDDTECFIGLTDEEYLDANGASWVASAHRRGTGAWNAAQIIEGPGSPQRMGEVMAMAGPYLVAGMPSDDGTGADSGAVMVWRMLTLPTNGERWFPLGRLQSPAPVPGERFGAAIAVHTQDLGENGCWIAVGAPGANADRGKVYLFNLSPSLDAAPPQAITIIPDGSLAAGDRFGAAVSLAGPSSGEGPAILAVGIPGRDTGGTDAGAVQLFKQDAGGANGWGWWRDIPRPALPGGTLFGMRLAFAGPNYLAVTQPPGGGGAGVVHLFPRNQGGADSWGLLATRNAPPGAPERFAESLSGSRFGVVVGAPGGAAGRAYYYGPGSFELLETFGDAAAGTDFGAAVAISDFGGIVVGDPSANSGFGRIHAWLLTAIAPAIVWEQHFASDGFFGSKLGTSVGTGLIYFAGGAPDASGAGNAYGQVELFRAGSYEVWAAGQGAGFDAWYPEQDPDGDGQANLIEFSLGSDPRGFERGSFEMSSTTFASGSTSFPAMRFTRPTLPYVTGGLHYRMEGCADMAAWRQLRYEIEPLGNPGERFYGAPPPRFFYRLAPKYPDFNPEDEAPIIIVPGG